MIKNRWRGGPAASTGLQCRSQGSNRTGCRRGRTRLSGVRRTSARTRRCPSPSSEPCDRTNLTTATWKYQAPAEWR